MPVPPRKPFRYTCPQCDWKGPVQDSDVICGPFDCPDCSIKLVRKPVSALEQLGGLTKLLKIFNR